MRSLLVTKPWLLLMATLLMPPLWGQTSVASSDSGLVKARQLFRQGDFHGSAADFRQIIAKEPSPEAYAGLVQSLLKLDDVKTADESSEKALAALPNSAATHAARGDVYFRRGLIPEAEDEYKTALKLDETCPRAWLGQGKVDAAYARRDQSKTAVAKAHELDPEDGDALYEWAVRQPYPDNVAALEKHLAEFRNDEETERHEREYKEFIKALAGRRVWIPARDVDRTEINLELLTIGPNMVHRGYGVRVRLNDRASVTLLFDTGSSGIV
ncbi:MAG TPA: tetratricopeptide repeat protein, partial [Candidatus Angelobacter sp.]|nr:tetratricopeptide repeat protein [Candidatus Angelobacter sp.]